MNNTPIFIDLASWFKALASLSYLQPQIEDIYARAVKLDVETPVIDPLRDLLHGKSPGLRSPRSLTCHSTEYAALECQSHQANRTHQSSFD